MLSIIVPVYNREKYIKKCLDSILGQTYSQIEVICVDDGSDDSSLEILCEYKRIDNRLKVFHQNHGGPSLVRKRGCMESIGEYITFVDSDDWIDNNMYADMMKLALENDADVVTSGYIREYENATKITNEGIDSGLYEGDDLTNQYFSNIVGMNEFFEFNVPGSVSNKIFKAELLKKYMYMTPENLHMGDDAAVSYPVLLNSDRIVVSGKSYYHYLIHKNSITSSTNTYININEVDDLFEYIDATLESKYQEIPPLKTQIELWKKYILLSKWPEKVLRKENNTLFPYSNLRLEDRIVLYGNGRFGRFLHQVLGAYGYNVVGIADSREKTGVIGINDLTSVEFDKIVISVLRANEVREIRDVLEKKGIPEEKIQFIECDMLKKDIEKRG